MGWKVESRGIPHLAKNERDVGHPTILGGVGVAGGGPVDYLRGCYDRWDGRWSLGGFVGDVGLDGVLHKLASAVEREFFFDVSLVGFDGFYAEV
jgi:hypothetical protein